MEAFIPPTVVGLALENAGSADESAKEVDPLPVVVFVVVIAVVAALFVFFFSPSFSVRLFLEVGDSILPRTSCKVSPSTHHDLGGAYASSQIPPLPWVFLVSTVAPGYSWDSPWTSVL